MYKRRSVAAVGPGAGSSVGRTYEGCVGKREEREKMRDGWFYGSACSQSHAKLTTQEMKFSSCQRPIRFSSHFFVLCSLCLPYAPPGGTNQSGAIPSRFGLVPSLIEPHSMLDLESRFPSVNIPIIIPFLSLSPTYWDTSILKT